MVIHRHLIEKPKKKMINQKKIFINHFNCFMGEICVQNLTTRCYIVSFIFDEVYLEIK